MGSNHDTSMGSGRNAKRKKVEKTERKSNVKISSELPPHLIQLILAKLPHVYLASHRLVSKAWQGMVLDHASSFKSVPDSFFISLVYGENLPFRPPLVDVSESHSNMYCMDFDAKHANGMEFVARFEFSPPWLYCDIVNSCNGLLGIIQKNCLGHSCVLNPMTNEYMELPSEEGSYLTADGVCSELYGLGFSLKTRRYKMIRIVFRVHLNDYITITHTKMQICTVGCSSEWRCINSMPLDVCPKYPVVYLNGALYWVGENRNTTMIYRFDVEDENFEAVSLPKVDSINAYSVYIQVFNGRLCATLCDERKQDDEIEVWMMRSHRGEDSWTREFVVKDLLEDWDVMFLGRLLFQLIKPCEDGEILCLIGSRWLCLYNPKNGRIRTLMMQNNRDINCLADIHRIESRNFDSLEKMLAGDGSSSSS